MRISARNQLTGTVKSIHHGEVNTEVEVEIAPGVHVVAVVTRHSAEALGLAPGSAATAIIKASDVMLGV